MHCVEPVAKDRTQGYSCSVAAVTRLKILTLGCGEVIEEEGMGWEEDCKRVCVGVFAQLVVAVGYPTDHSLSEICLTDVILDNSFPLHDFGLIFSADSDQSDSHSPRSPHLPHLCYGCKKPFEGTYRLRVSPDMEWHPSCLVCSECQRNLDEFCTCFIKDGRPYCKKDYMK